MKNEQVQVLLFVVCPLYKRVANGEEKNCWSQRICWTILRIVPLLLAMIVVLQVVMIARASYSRKVVKRVFGMKTLDSFVKCTEKKVSKQTKILIRKRTATLVAAAKLPYCFVEQEPLKDFILAFCRFRCRLWECSCLRFYCWMENKSK